MQSTQTYLGHVHIRVTQRPSSSTSTRTRSCASILGCCVHKADASFPLESRETSALPVAYTPPSTIREVDAAVVAGGGNHADLEISRTSQGARSIPRESTIGTRDPGPSLRMIFVARSASRIWPKVLHKHTERRR